MNRRALAAAVTAAALTVPLSLAAVAPASAAGTAQSTEVAAKPSMITPIIHDGAVYAVTQVGSTIVVGGSFTQTEAKGDPSTLLSTPYVLAFDAATGALQSSFSPKLTGGSPGTAVNTLLPGPTPGTVYVGGVFTAVNGVTTKGLVLLNLADGSKVTSFAVPTLDLANVQSVRRLGTRLFVGGAFTKVGGVPHGGIATLNATTGALDPYMGSAVTVNHSWTPTSPAGSAKAAVGVSKLDVSPDGTKLVAIGNFKQVDGTSHDQIAMWDLGAGGASLRAWGTSRFQALCNTNAYDSYVRDVSFSPDGAYFVVASTGGYGPAGSLCDSAARWETGPTGADLAPSWVDYTGKDTLLSVAITGTAVYVGGHERWMNNPTGADSPGPGAVPRPGVAALDPDTGLPLAWNPGRAPRGAGTWTLFATPDGLWMGSDTDYVGNYQYKRGKLAFFPLAGGAAAAGKAVPGLPGTVVSGTVPASPASGVLYRVNAGGPLLRSIDSGPDWAADNGTSTLRNTGSTATSYASPVPNLSSSVPAGTPSAVFSTERYDPGTKGDNGEMQWHFPVPAGKQVDVRLSFANRASSTQGVGKRVFDVTIDGQVRQNNYDVSASAGDQTGTTLTFPVTSDGTVDITFTHEVNNPEVNAIEIIPSGAPAAALPAGSVSARSFTGSSAGNASPVASPLDPGQVHGAMVVGNQLFYGSSDGNLYKRTVSGGSYGPETLVDPYDDPYWSGVQTGSGQTYRGTKPNFFAKLTNVTSMSFDGVGRMYYTYYGSTSLWTRQFNPDAGLMSSDESTVPGTLPTGVTGSFLAGGSLYVATSDGQLRRQALNGLAGLSGTATVIGGPNVDGVNWSSPLLYLDAQDQPPVASPTVSCTDLTCTADGSASRASGGSIASYQWTWGDGTSTSGVTSSHTYATPGNYPVTLTVTDGAGATGTATRYAAPAAHVNAAPTASFTSTCTALTCTADGGGSSDPDGTVTGWAWDFGDGATATGRTASHAYATGGTYAVRLTVTDDAGASATTTRSVTVAPAPVSGISFRGSSTATQTSGTSITVTVPAGVQPGDALLLKVGTATTGAPAAPTGWALLDSTGFAAGAAQQALWQRVATAADAPGNAVTVTLGGGSAKTTAQLLAYSGTATTSPATAVSAVDTSYTTSHTAPATTTTAAGSWVVWSWSDKSATTASWALPAGVTARASSSSNVSAGFVSSALGDAGAWAAGQVPAQTATTSSATKGIATTIVLTPAG